MKRFLKLFRLAQSKNLFQTFPPFGRVGVGFFLLFNLNSAHAQLTFNNGLTAQALAQMLAGPGVTISNATINCAANAIGSFTGSSSIGITTGILLTTGSTSVASPNTSSGSAGECNNTPGDDAALLSLSGATTYDACALEFDIIPLCDTLEFNYSFGSDEYPEFVNSGFNDAFAFYVSGPGITGQPNIAQLPGTSTFVTIDNVNSGANSQYFVTNSGTTIEYDGYTTVLTAWSVVQACQTYHIKIVIADAGDCSFDSGVFLKAGSLQCQSVSATATVQDAVEGCQDGSFQFCRPGSTTSPLTVTYTIAGSAINGTDYTTISNSIIIPAGQSCITLPITPIADGTTESAETILIIYQPGPCPLMDTVIITITDNLSINAGPDVTFCSGGNASIGPTSVSGTTYSWTPATGLSSATSSNPTVTLTNGGTSPITTNYTLTATTSGCTSSDTVAITVSLSPSANAGPDQTICGGPTVLAGSISGSATFGTWTGGAGTFNPNDTSLNSAYTPSAGEITAGTVTLTLTTDVPVGQCPAANDDMIITISSNSFMSAGPDTTFCSGGNATIGISPVTGTTYLWTPATGLSSATSSNPTVTLTNGGTSPIITNYTLTATTSSCSASDIVAVTVNPSSSANAGSSQYLCSGLSITLAGSVTAPATGGTWSGGNGTYLPDNTTLNAVYTPSTTEYAADSVLLTLTPNDPGGSCPISTSNVIFYFYENPIVNFTTTDSVGCSIHCTNFTNATTIGSGDVSWNWNFGDGSPGSNLQNPAHCFSASGFYDIMLTATSNLGCVSFLTQIDLIQVASVPVAAFDPTPNPATLIDPTITFNNQSSSDVNYWNWNFGDGDSLAPGIANPEHAYPNDTSGSYLVTLIVHNMGGCYDTVIHEIIIRPSFSFFIPSAFSPNGNERNDYFFGSGTGIKKYNLWIFDRWGNMVFHGKELNDKWDGKANDDGNTAQIDVYVWKVELTDVLNKKHNYMGTVTIVE